MGKAVKSVTKAVAPGLGGITNAITGKGAAGNKVTIDRKQFADSQAQQDFNKLLKDRMEGKAPSLAQEQLRQSTDRTMAQQIAAAKSQRGNQALAGREAARLGAAAQQEAAGQGAILRLQEQEAAQQAYGADLERQQQNKIQAELANVGALQNFEARKSQATQAAQAGQRAMIMEGAKSAIAASDENLKKNIKKADLSELVDKIKAYKFEYKSPNGESYQDGSVDGVMAQDLEKSKLGKSLVQNTKEGKMVDLKKAVPLMMASVSEIAKEIKKLKEKKG